jgi:hypothetical protein
MITPRAATVIYLFEILLVVSVIQTIDNNNTSAVVIRSLEINAIVSLVSSLVNNH